MCGWCWQMGHQIAMLGALAGFNTILQAVNIEALQKAESTLHTIMNKWVNKGMVSEDTKEAAFLVDGGWLIK